MGLFKSKRDKAVLMYEDVYGRRIQQVYAELLKRGTPLEPEVLTGLHEDAMSVANGATVGYYKIELPREAMDIILKARVENELGWEIP